MITRPPRSNARQKDQPDSLGRWWFQGYNITVVAGVQTITPVQNRPFDVVADGDKFLPVIPDTGLPYEGSSLVGWWLAEEDMAQPG